MVTAYPEISCAACIFARISPTRVLNAVILDVARYPVEGLTNRGELTYGNRAARTALRLLFIVRLRAIVLKSPVEQVWSFDM